eukprot:2141695-Prymnesium_polylepis.1
MARGFIKNVHLAQPVGGWACIHRNDLERIAPLWLELTKEVRKNPQRYWHSESRASREAREHELHSPQTRGGGRRLACYACCDRWTCVPVWEAVCKSMTGGSPVLRALSLSLSCPRIGHCTYTALCARSRVSTQPSAAHASAACARRCCAAPQCRPSPIQSRTT